MALPQEFPGRDRGSALREPLVLSDLVTDAGAAADENRAFVKEIPGPADGGDLTMRTADTPSPVGVMRLFLCKHA